VKVSVVYARPNATLHEEIVCEPGATVSDVLALVLDRLRVTPDASWSAGIHGRAVALDATVADGDRVEIYRPLQANAKEMRRRRARNNNKA
jgi:uncharacterized protein